MIEKIYDDKEMYRIVEPILRNTEFQRRKTFLHHQDSVYDHSLSVAYAAYKIAKRLSKYRSININNVVVGAMLHDFYETPWRDNKNPKFFKKHGFTHAGIAVHNAYNFFPSMMNQRIEDAIKRHMFPLNVTPPKYIEGWIVTLADKYVSLEVFKKPKELPRYIGIKVPTKRISSRCKEIFNLTKGFVSNMY